MTSEIGISMSINLEEIEARVTSLEKADIDTLRFLEKMVETQTELLENMRVLAKAMSTRT